MTQNEFLVMSYLSYIFISRATVIKTLQYQRTLLCTVPYLTPTIVLLPVS